VPTLDSIAILDRPPPPGKYAAAALAVAMHIGLAVFLIYGVRWQTQVQEAVEVELVTSVPATQASPRPAPEPEPEVKPEPKPVPKVEPKPEPKPVPVKPDIAVKEKEKPKPKEEPKPDPFKDALEKELKQHQQSKPQPPTPSPLSALDKELSQLKATQAASARKKAEGDYIGKIKGKIKGNIVLPPDMKGNPEAVFEVTQLPSGEIITVKLKKSSGNSAWDGATERAIHKSSPLPKPDMSEAFSRVLELHFRPLEE